MIRVGSMDLNLINGPVSRPKSRKDMKIFLRSFCRDFGMDVRFVVRKRETYNYYDFQKSRAVICEGLENNLVGMWDLPFFTFHELAHHLQYHTGLFKKYYDRRRNKSRRSVALRAERHCDQLSRKLCREVFGENFDRRNIRYISVYDDVNEGRSILDKFYNW